MAEESRSDNLSSLRKELFSEVREQKRQIITIQEVRANSAIVSSQVKKLKCEQNFIWKKTGNKIQFTFNSEVKRQYKARSIGSW